LICGADPPEIFPVCQPARVIVRIRAGIETQGPCRVSESNEIN
jgi:hypothetical protein